MSLSRWAATLAGVFAAVGTGCLLMVLRYTGLVRPFDFYEQTFGLPSHISGWTWAMGMVASYAVAALVGWFALNQRDYY